MDWIPDLGSDQPGPGLAGPWFREGLPSPPPDSPVPSGSPSETGDLPPTPDPQARDLRDRLRRARLMLLFTPELCGEGRDPLEVLEAALPSVDVLQVRVKGREGTSEARSLLEWTERVLQLLRAHPALEPIVVVNDRVDVAAVLGERGVDGVHLGTGDTPPERARTVVGERLLIGLSTHSARQVLEAEEREVDYVGFGPVHATATKGYEEGLGSEAAWIADSATPLPLFPIGGINPTNAAELASVGRAAVSAAILGAADPGEAAAALRHALS